MRTPNAYRAKTDSPARLGLWCLVLCLGPGWAQAESRSVSAHITYQLPEGVYVDVGTENGLAPDLCGQAHHPQGAVWLFEVQNVTRKSALLRLEGVGPLEFLRGETIELIFEVLGDAATPPPEDNPPPMMDPNVTTVTKPFVPLLTPVKQAPKASVSRNVGHGYVQLNQAWQSASDSQREYGMTRASTGGSLERLQGSPWSFEWSGQASYRAGQAYRSHPDYQEVIPVIHLASFYRPLTDDRFVRAGRFLPRELPGLGYLDGLQSELGWQGPWRFGIAGGFKPERNDLAFSGKEPTLAGYTTLELGKRNDHYYSGTLGLLGSLYEGKTDRLAILWDQKADWGPRMHLRGTLEMDLGVADTSTQTGTQLTRLNLSAVTRVTRVLTFRGGVDHWQRPDTQAERGRLGIDDSRYFDKGYWCYWIGGQQTLQSHWTATQEISLMNSASTETYTHWRLGLARNGLGVWSGASLRSTVFNLKGGGLDGYGVTFSAYLPLHDARWSLQPAMGLRWAQTQAQSNDLSITYFTFRFNGRLDNTWTLYGGINPSMGDGADATLMDLGLRYRW